MWLIVRVIVDRFFAVESVIGLNQKKKEEKNHHMH